MHTSSSENAGQHGAWLGHLPREALADDLQAGEVLLLDARVGGGREVADDWLAELREMAARGAEDDGCKHGRLLDRLELLGRVAVVAGCLPCGRLSGRRG